MINLFEKFDRASADLLASQRAAEIKIPTIVMNDEGFLPADVDSPARTFGHYDEGRPGLYFDHLSVPRYWRVVGDQYAAGIYHQSQKKANVEYLHQDNQRIVKAVQWLDTTGGYQWVDHYNQWGYRFAQTIYDHGQAVLKKYFASDGHQYAFYNLINGSLILDDRGQRYCFSQLTDFWRFYLARQRYDLDRVLYNTLNQSYQVTLDLEKGGADTLFWHEPLTGEVPDNMRHLMTTPTRTKHIVFQRYRDWQQHGTHLSSDNVDFHYLGMIYPKRRQNLGRPRALIVTNSDQIEQLQEIVAALPKVYFDVAALTAMSKKLLAVGERANVTVYPNISLAHLESLFATDDILLDINYGDEVLDTVRRAFEQDMLILGFDSTIHQDQYVALQDVFSKGAGQSLVHRIQQALADRSVMDKLVQEQRLEAGMVTPADYRHVFGLLTR